VNVFKNKIPALVLLVLFGSMLESANYCVFAGITDAVTLKSRSELGTFQRIGKVPDPVAWERLVSDFADASRVVPDASEYYENIAYLFALRGASAIGFSNLAQLNFSKAVTNYKQSLRMRPMTGRTWANLSLASFYLGIENKEIASYFDNSLAFGPFDASTQMPLISLYNNRWSGLSTKQKYELRNVLMQAKDPAIRNLGLSIPNSD